MKEVPTAKRAKRKGFISRFIDTVFRGTIDLSDSKGTKEKNNAPMTAAMSPGYRREDEGWRKLTATPTRDLLNVPQENMIDIAYWLWETNPLARWIIEIIKDFIVADGVPYDTKNDEVKKILEDFWYDPVNRMDINIEKHARELHIYGELIFPAFIAQQTGKIRLGYIDPKQVDKIITDPENVKMQIGLILKSEAGVQARQYRIILPEGSEFVLSARAQAMRASFLDGECFFFSINNVTNAPRGKSEIFVTSDWLDAYEQFLFDYADRWPLLNTFIWDLQVEGGDENDINKHIKNFTKKSGSVFGHNDKVTLEPKTPDLKSQDAETGARLLRNHILGAHGIPSFWYGGGEDANRALGVEMGTPTFKMMASKQRYFKYILETIFDQVIGRAMEANYLKLSEEEAYQYTINMPELSSKDASKYSAAIQQLTLSIITAMDRGLLDKQTAVKIYAFAMGMIGYEIDTDDVLSAIEKEESAKGYEDYMASKYT
jgi:hypothetical protein